MDSSFAGDLQEEWGILLAANFGVAPEGRSVIANLSHPQDYRREAVLRSSYSSM